jgi:hypothetical protein
MGGPVTLRYVTALLALVGGGAAPSTSGTERISGKYDVAGTAHVSISPFPVHDYPGELTATLSRSPAPGAFSLRLEARGYACTLPVRAARDGSLQFPDRAACPLDISQSDARGHVDAQLRTARGRVVEDRLEMDLQFDVNGSIQMKIPSRTIRIFGAEIQSPATWAPTAPVHGTIAASGQGPRSPDPSTPR